MKSKNMIQQSLSVLLFFFSFVSASKYHAENGLDLDLDLELSLKKLGQSHRLETKEKDDQTFSRSEHQHLSQFSEAGDQFERKNDIFVEKRWYNYYADQPHTRDSRVMNGLTQEQKDSIVNLHNKLRRGEGASNMETLRYNEKLAALGQSWAQRCVFEHGQPPFSEADIGYKNLGQNIFAHTDPKMTVEMAVQAWFDEKPDFDYNSVTCRAGKVCGHYTAVTWATTTDVGCGLVFCPSISGLTNAHFIVCNYAPPGNWAGEKPFKKGPPCTQCDSGKFYCNNGLCDKSCSSEGPNCQCKAACKQCGKKTSGCGCDCKPGTMGSDCSAQCADLDPKCGANPGYPVFLCTMSDPNWAFVKDKCPKLCKKCSSARSMTCSKRSAETMTELKRLMISYLESELDQ